MKNNRIVMLLLAVVTIFSLTACKGNDDVENENTNPNTNSNTIVDSISGDVSGDENTVIDFEISEEELLNFNNQFKEEIKDYIGYMTNIKLFLESSDEASYVDYGVSSFLTHLKDTEDPFSALSYMLKDLNGDGIDEIMLFDDTLQEDMKNIIISMSVLDGELTNNILNSQEDMLYRLYENNIIGVEMPSTNCMTFFELDKDMNLVPVDFIDVTTSSGDSQKILNKYKVADLQLNKVK